MTGLPSGGSQLTRQFGEIFVGVISLDFLGIVLGYVQGDRESG